MTLNRLDAEGLPPEGIERTLAHHFLGRPNRLAKDVLYHLLGGPRRNAELLPLVGPRSDNNLTQVLRLLVQEGVVGTVVDARTKPAAIAYRLTTLGLVVVDWMRTFEIFEAMRQAGAQNAPPVRA